MFYSIGVASLHFKTVLANMASWITIGNRSKSSSNIDRSKKHDDSLRCDKSVLEHTNSDYHGNRDLFGSPAYNSELSVVEDLLRLSAFPNAKELAQKALTEFGSIPKLIDASPRRLKSVGAYNSQLINNLALIKQTLHYYLKPNTAQPMQLAQHYQLINYLVLHHGYLPFEQVRVVYLDNKDYLIQDQLVSSGTPQQSALYVRNILHQALDLGACGIILVHNHPSGAEVEPSHQDRLITNKIYAGCRFMEIKLIDHIIISKDKYYSFKFDSQL